MSRPPLTLMQDALRQVRSFLELEIAAVGPLLPVEFAEEVPAAPKVRAETEDLIMPQEVPATFTSVPRSGGDGAPTTDRFAALIPANSPLHEIGSLEELAAYVASARLIALDESRTNPVFGVGNPEADLMVVGEAPGADEDLKGEPFVGRAGQLLDKILEATGFDRKSVYIANILKSRPPNNRNPLPDEIAAHVPILYRQISLIRPRMILSVGRVSACALLGRQDSLSSLRGKLHDFHGVPLVVTYHPAALLRNPDWKRPTWEDMKFLRTHFDSIVAGG